MKRGDWACSKQVGTQAACQHMYPTLSQVGAGWILRTWAAWPDTRADPWAAPHNPGFVAWLSSRFYSPMVLTASASPDSVHPARERIWGVVPCGGSGARAGGSVPKQYQTVAGLPVVAHTLQALAQVPAISGVVLAVSAADDWHSQPMAGVPDGGLARLPAVCARAADWLRVLPVAGATRAHTVFNSLMAWAAAGAHPHDWVLVHDAARCLATPVQIGQLVEACRVDPVGGLLALKLPDTLKQGANNRASHTVPRDDKWLAQTPQMFRLGELMHAMEAARRNDFADITDEASAMEAQGQMPLLVPGTADNFKVTYPPDFALAQAILRSRTA